MPTDSARSMRPRPAALRIRLAPDDMRRLALAADAAHQDPADLAGTIIRQQLAAFELALAPLSVAAAPELAEVASGPLARSKGESSARYAARAALFADLVAIPDDS